MRTHTERNPMNVFNVEKPSVRVLHSIIHKRIHTGRGNPVTVKNVRLPFSLS